MVAVRTCVHKPCASQIYLSLTVFLQIYIVYIHACIYILRHRKSNSHIEGLEYGLFRQSRFERRVFVTLDHASSSSYLLGFFMILPSYHRYDVLRVQIKSEISTSSKHFGSENLWKTVRCITVEKIYCYRDERSNVRKCASVFVRGYISKFDLFELSMQYREMAILCQIFVH